MFLYKAPSWLWWCYLWSAREGIAQEQDWISSIQCVSCHNRSCKRDLQRIAIPGIRFGISQKQKMVKAYVLFLQTLKPLYLFNLIPPKLNSLRHPSTYSLMRCRNDYFKNSFIPYVVKEWNRLSTKIRNSTSWQQFRKLLLSLIKPSCSSLFSVHDLVGVKLLIRLRLSFNYSC